MEILSAIIVWGGIIYAIYLFATRKKRKKQKDEKEKRWREEYSSVITESKVRQRWAGTIAGMGGHGELLMNSIARRIQNENIPDVVVSRRPMKIEGASEPHPFVVVSSTNAMLKAYKILVNATDYGKRLNVVWFVIFDIMEIHNGAMYGKGAIETEAVGSYVAVVRSLFLDELKKVMDGLNLDFTKVNAATRGFTNLS